LSETESEESSEFRISGENKSTSENIKEKCKDELQELMEETTKT
jgi:hypothetical protein